MRTNSGAMGDMGKPRMIGLVERSPEPGSPFPPSMVLSPISRRPLRLLDATVRAVLNKPVPDGRAWHAGGSTQVANPRASIVVVTFNNLVFTRLCLESALANTDDEYELIV